MVTTFQHFPHDDLSMVCVCVRVCVCVGACNRACVLAFVRACVRACVGQGLLHLLKTRLVML